jgi:hypothetical protein
MQMRLNDVSINERPKLLTKRPTEDAHAVIVEELLIPLDMHNVSSLFPGSRPTRKEYDECMRIDITYAYPEWKPHSPLCAEEEAKCKDEDIYVTKFRRVISFQTNNISFDEKECFRGIGSMKIAFFGGLSPLEVSAIQSEKYKLTPDVLCKNWTCGKTVAERTLEATPQLMVRTVAYHHIQRR